MPQADGSSTGWLWPEWFWLPPTFSWSDFNASGGPRLSDLWMSVVCGVAIFLWRQVLLVLVLRPLGRRYRLRDSSFSPRTPEDRSLELAYQQAAAGRPADCSLLAKKLARSEAWVANWMRRRRNCARANEMAKFCESAWQLVFYSCSFCFGLVVLWEAPYLSDTRLLWRGWPRHELTRGLYWYYMLELGFYYSTLATVCSDTKRKDFWEMVVHHLATVLLMTFSWTLGFTRVGAVILLLHDAADPLLNLAKIGSYLKLRVISDPAFALLLLVWGFTRLYLFPLRVVYSCVFELQVEIGVSPAIMGLQLLLLLLQVLHIIWTYFIAKVVLRLLLAGERQDSRSDSEASD